MKSSHFRILVLVTTHNRKAETLRFLDSIFNQRLAPSISFKVVLADAGSTDGTVEAINHLYPQVLVKTCSANVFWNRGMIIAWQYALECGVDSDFVAAANDDVVLRTDAMKIILDDYALIKKWQPTTEHMIAGAMSNPTTGTCSYSGYKLGPWFKRLGMTLIAPNGQTPQSCDATNMNFTLIPTATINAHGWLDSIYSHSMGDFDFSLRLRKLGVASWITSQFIGQCAANSGHLVLRSSHLSLSDRLRRTFSLKGFPVHEWFTFCYRHGGISWPISFFLPYFRSLFARREP